MRSLHGPHPSTPLPLTQVPQKPTAAAAGASRASAARTAATRPHVCAMVGVTGASRWGYTECRAAAGFEVC